MHQHKLTNPTERARKRRGKASNCASRSDYRSRPDTVRFKRSTVSHCASTCSCRQLEARRKKHRKQGEKKSERGRHFPSVLPSTRRCTYVSVGVVIPSVGLLTMLCGLCWARLGSHSRNVNTGFVIPPPFCCSVSKFFPRKGFSNPLPSSAAKPTLLRPKSCRSQVRGTFSGIPGGMVVRPHRESNSFVRDATTI